MPELPEAYITSVQLNKAISNWNLIQVELLPNAKHDNMDKIQLPLKITRITSQGKKIVFVLCNSEGEISAIITSLGMTGHWGFTQRKHCHLILHFKNDKEEKKVFYDDSRRFGRNCYVTNDEQYKSKIPKGLCYLRDRNLITYEVFRDSVRKPTRKNMGICKFLMCQDHFCGVGNYIKSECLYLSRMDPHRKLETLTDSEICVLLQAIFWVIDTSISCNGLTISDFSSPNEDKGIYDTHVYGKTADRYGNDVIRSETDDKRTTHWVPDIQI